MKKAFTIIATIGTLLLAGTSFAGSARGTSKQATVHSGKALNHVGKSVVYGAAGSAQVASGAVAVPFKAVGTVVKAAGKASEEFGDDLWNYADGKPFEISDKHVVKADPAPHESL